jgi:hypothetical protein
MPTLDIQSVSLEDGVDVVWRGQHYHWTSDDVLLVPGNMKKKEDKVNEWAREAFESRHLLSEYDSDHRVRQDPPVLRYYERIEGDEIVITQMYVAIHIYTLGPPVKLNIMCSQEPITGEWW